jgi:hypothetical protein
VNRWSNPSSCHKVKLLVLINAQHSTQLITGFEESKMMIPQDNSEPRNTLSIQVIPIHGLEDNVTDKRMNQIWLRIAKYIHKFGKGFRDGYQKRVHHDQIVSKVEYQDLYYSMKLKYKHWVEDWPEDTDPSKFGKRFFPKEYY